ncbi:hypothetical protein BDZ91DRAFT_489947 [Kalaharituber pfeilii]|nr:hypothetical protein BDZ91DRAFT_489947 [Kalaharituber pfeilii]
MYPSPNHRTLTPTTTSGFSFPPVLVPQHPSLPPHQHHHHHPLPPPPPPHFLPPGAPSFLPPLPRPTGHPHLHHTAPHFKRSYQACLPCRSRKVRCDLGNPDAPNAPPCARCRREGKECVFSGPRASTKKKTSVTGEGEERTAEMTSIEESDVARARKRTRSSTASPYPVRRWDKETCSYRRVRLPMKEQQVQQDPEYPTVDGRVSVGPRGLASQAEILATSEPKRRRTLGNGHESRFQSSVLATGRTRKRVQSTNRIPVASDSPLTVEGEGDEHYYREGDSARESERDEERGGGSEGEENEDGEEGEEDILVTTEMHSTHDAMNLLFQAAERISQASPPRTSDEQDEDQEEDGAEDEANDGDEDNDDDNWEDTEGEGNDENARTGLSQGGSGRRNHTNEMGGNLQKIDVGHCGGEGGTKIMNNETAARKISSTPQSPEQRRQNGESGPTRAKSSSPKLRRKRQLSGTHGTSAHSIDPAPQSCHVHLWGTQQQELNTTHNQASATNSFSHPHPRRRRAISKVRLPLSHLASTPLELPPASATPWLFQTHPSLSPNPSMETLHRALQAWANFKFVHLKWLTPLEAFTYINYFHSHLLPLSPILSPYFALPSTQQELLESEPLLVMTILTIAARYCPLGGTAGNGRGGGTNSRGVYLHERFWQFTQGLVGRVIWGQDRGSGKKRGKDTKGLRGLGTVEALLLWTEWHPRGIHFPPVEVGGEEELMGSGMGAGIGLEGVVGGRSGRTGEGDGWDVSLVIGPLENDRGGERQDDDNSGADEEERAKEVSQRDRWLEEVIEPTRRSDRLSWMLLGTALTLAHELGIFDTTPDESEEPPAAPFDTETPRRIFRLRKLCYIYLHSLSTRLNWSSPLDNNRRLLSIITNNTATSYHSTNVLGQLPRLSEYEQKWHKIVALYLDLTVLVRSATEMLFPSKKYTKDIVSSGRYVPVVEHLGQVLAAWERGAEELNQRASYYPRGATDDEERELEDKGVLIPRKFWDVLRIEFCYAKIFVYCISLEAVAERRQRQASCGGKEKSGDKEKGKEGGQRSKWEGIMATGVLSAGLIGGAFGEEEVDWDFIQMAFHSGLEILSIVVNGGGEDLQSQEFTPGKVAGMSTQHPPPVPWLRFAPVRVYVRIIFAAIFLLKATALLLSLGPGITPNTTRAAIITQSKKCLGLLSRTAAALRRCAVDDVHLANTFADLLGMHVQWLRWKIYAKGHGRRRGSAGGRGGRERERERGRKETDHLRKSEEEEQGGVSRDRDGEVEVVFPPTPERMKDDDTGTASPGGGTGGINEGGAACINQIQSNGIQEALPATLVDGPSSCLASALASDPSLLSSGQSYRQHSIAMAKQQNSTSPRTTNNTSLTTVTAPYIPIPMSTTTSGVGPTPVWAQHGHGQPPLLHSPVESLSPTSVSWQSAPAASLPLPLNSAGGLITAGGSEMLNISTLGFPSYPRTILILTSMRRWS